jgi:O-methyltransferase
MWKERVNALLTKTTGYQLQKAGGAAAAPQPAPARPKAPKSRPKPAGPRRPRFPAHMDENAIRVIQRVRPRTMTGKEKLFGLILATRYLAQNAVPGDFVECGVWRGGSMQAAALTLIEEGDTRRHLHLFDTYEGMSEPTEKDRRNDGKSASELLAEADKDRKVWAYAGLEDVQEGMAELDYPQDQIHFHQGMVEETIPDKAPETIAMLRLDTDWYESTRHELEHLYHRLSPGGVLILDDYGHWEGARLAAQEFMKEHGARLVLLPLGSGRIAIKPWA